MEIWSSGTQEAVYASHGAPRHVRGVTSGAGAGGLSRMTLDPHGGIAGVLYPPA